MALNSFVKMAETEIRGLSPEQQLQYLQKKAIAEGVLPSEVNRWIIENYPDLSGAVRAVIDRQESRAYPAPAQMSGRGRVLPVPSVQAPRQQSVELVPPVVADSERPEPPRESVSRAEELPAAPMEKVSPEIKGEVEIGNVVEDMEKVRAETAEVLAREGGIPKEEVKTEEKKPQIVVKPEVSAAMTPLDVPVDLDSIVGYRPSDKVMADLEEAKKADVKDPDKWVAWLLSRLKETLGLQRSA